MSTDFRNVLKYQILWKSFNWEPSCCMRTETNTQGDKRVDGQKWRGQSSLFAIRKFLFWAAVFGLWNVMQRNIFLCFYCRIIQFLNHFRSYVESHSTVHSVLGGPMSISHRHRVLKCFMLVFLTFCHLVAAVVTLKIREVRQKINLEKTVDFISFFFSLISSAYSCKRWGLLLDLIALRQTTLGRNPLEERSAHSRDLYLTTHETDIHDRRGIRTHIPKRWAGKVSSSRLRDHSQTHHTGQESSGRRIGP